MSSANRTDPNRELRNVVELAALPATWADADPIRIAESLACALSAGLGAEFVYVSLLPGEDCAPVSIAHTGRYGADPELSAQFGPRILEWSRAHSPDQLMFLPNAKGSGTLRVSAHALGPGAELGVVAAGFLGDEALGDFQRSLLNVGASQGAAATQNVRLVQSLSRRNDRYQTLFNQSPLGIYLVDADFLIRETNPVAHAAFGDIPGLIGRDFGEVAYLLLEDDYAEEVVNRFRHTLETGEPFLTPERAEFRRDRSTVEYYEWRLDRITLPDGRFGVLCHFRDIAEEVVVRRKIAQSEERFRALVTASTDVVYSLTPDWSERRQLRGRDIIPDTLESNENWLQKYVLPADRTSITKEIQEAIRRKGAFEMEHRVIRADGSIGWTLWHATPVLDANGEILEWFGAASDVTRRRRAEEGLRESRAEIERQRRLYEAILTNTPDLAYVWDLNHRFTYANDGLLKMWGKTRDEAIGKNCLELGYEPWHAAMHDQEIEQVVATRRPVRGEVPFSGAFGRRIYDYILVPVVGPDGAVEAVAGTTRDVTDYRIAEQQLREADRRKDEFLATLAHELRNPLAPLRTGLELMKLANGDIASIEKIRAMMERQLRQLVSLVDDLLDISRISQNKLELRRAPALLADVIQMGVESANLPVKQSRHKLTVTIPDSPVTIDADQNRIAQILSNLLSNSAQYTPEGGHIQLSARTDGQNLILSVKDNGIGIAPEMLDAIFGMFAQIVPDPEELHSGLGVGLTLVKSLVELHGGTIAAHSAGHNQGSEFTATMPIVRPARSAVEASREESAAPMKKRKVLIVDDNKPGAELLSMLVKTLGSEVRTAGDGREAIDVAADFQPDLILMDLGMPKMNGYDAARHIRRQPWGANIALIALTGWGQEEAKLRTREAGFDRHLIKPVDPATLRSLLSADFTQSSG